MTELELIRRLVPHLAAAGGDLLVGAGEDDAAAWREPDGRFTVATSDTSVEGVHFDLTRQPPEAVGWRALCFALGDLAAKGARPTFGLVSVSIPPGWPPETVEGIYRGLAGLAAEVGLRLVGGDTVASPVGALTLALLGAAAVSPLPRSAVRPGWLVGVTGPLGGASPAWDRPRPRLDAGARLAAAGLCCGDISDGLVRELDKFAAAAAGVGARLRADAVPLAPGATVERALASGEEVELVCCGPTLPAEVREVGQLTGDGRVAVVDGGGREIEVAERGYDHFA